VEVVLVEVVLVEEALVEKGVLADASQTQGKVTI
jgi:hypothetical protein